MNVIKPPIITKCKNKPYTKVSFKPDYARMGIPGGLTADMLSLFKRRVFDLSAVTDKSVRVKYNGEIVPTRTFSHYADLYIGDKSVTRRVYEEYGERWEYIVCISPSGEFCHTSFVNGISTSNGGKHVEYITNQIIRKLTVYIKNKTKIDVKPGTIKEQLWIFIKCVIDNPSFDSQSKNCMNTNISEFGSSCEVSEQFIEKVAKLGVMETACALTDVKTIKNIKKQDGTKSRHIRGIPKLVDANLAGGSNSHTCTLILCEGDSAKTGIISGLSTSDRDTIGVYPLRGKLFNVRDESMKRISEVKEINEIKQIVGLETGKTYTMEDTRTHLRYGKIVFMTDQDLDGSHIKGLCINLFEVEWPSLFHIPGFIGFMNTPIIKARNGSKELTFYNDNEYQKWKNDINTNGWTMKYYKGLGTSTPKEFKEYFANKKMVGFVSSGKKSSDAIKKVFSKTSVTLRKEWIREYDRAVGLDTSHLEILYEDFIDKEMIHFSKYDCERSIPNGVDGLKTGQRKILFTCFIRNLVQEIKVAQLGGSVSEKSKYHHGEQSLYGTIINMAQDFVGSNNINLLLPNGQFGTRIQGGDDAASERYIYTQLNSLTRLIYPKEDDAVLTYLEDDGEQVEPIFYVPIIPMQLVNGGKGIGTGYSTDIPNYDPNVIIDNVMRRLRPDTTNANINSMVPYYKGFTGTIAKITDHKYLIKGVYTVTDKTVHITDLPIGVWTDDYKKYIDDLMCGAATNTNNNNNKIKTKKVVGVIKDYTDMSTDVKIDITITFTPGSIAELMAQETEHGCNMLEKTLKLYTTKSTANINAFDEKEKLTKYDSAEEIIDNFMKIRIEYYHKRKKHQLYKLNQEFVVLSNKARFISEILADIIDLRKKKKGDIIALLQWRKYDIIDGDNTYKYLVHMPMDSVTEENSAKHIADSVNKRGEIDTLTKTDVTEIWVNELIHLRSEYNKSIAVSVNASENKSNKSKNNVVKKSTIKSKDTA